MKPSTGCKIYFHQSIKPDNKEDCNHHHNHIVEESQLRKLEENQHWEKEESHVGHQTELILVDNHTLLRAPVERSVQLVTEQFKQICSKQNSKANTDIGNERQFGHRIRDIVVTEHHQTCSDRKQVKEQQSKRGSVFQHFTLALHKREVALREQRPANQEKLSTKSEENQREQKKQNAENQRDPVIRLRHAVPLELRYRQPMPRKHGT